MQAAVQRTLPLLLVHGGLPPQETFAQQLRLRSRRALLTPSLPIEAPTAKGARRRDFDSDGEALAKLIETHAAEGAHLLGVSYGAISALACALLAPRLVRSLALVEAPLFAVALECPAVARFVAALERPFDRSRSTREEVRAAFAAFTSPSGRESRDPGARIAAVMSFIRGARPPAQAQIDLERLRRAEIPALVVSGAHHEALSVVSRRLAQGLGAQLLELHGWGHFPQCAPEFNEALESFLAAVEQGTTAASATFAAS